MPKNTERYVKQSIFTKKKQNTTRSDIWERVDREEFRWMRKDQSGLKKIAVDTGGS